MKFVRDSGRVLNGAPQFVGRPEGELQWQGKRLPGVAERTVGIFCLSGFVADRGQICFSPQSAALLPSCVRPICAPKAIPLFTKSLYSRCTPAPHWSSLYSVCSTVAVKDLPCMSIPEGRPRQRIRDGGGLSRIPSTDTSTIAQIPSVCCLQ